MNPGKNIRLFKRDWMEWFSYVHPITPILLWGPVVVYCFLSYPSLVLAVAGLCVWSLSEYLLHRFIFHFKPRSPFQARVAFLIHGIHHEDPEDARRLLMPPFAAVVLALIFYGLFTAILGAVLVKPFFAGFLVGYLCYDYTHFAVHFMKPRWKFLKTLKQNHMLHHFATPGLRYGVSSTLWDYVFRTRPASK